MTGAAKRERPLSGTELDSHSRPGADAHGSPVPAVRFPVSQHHVPGRPTSWRSGSRGKGLHALRDRLRLRKGFHLEQANKSSLSLANRKI